ncbi:MAG: hypothetical protein IKQ54_04605 [Oscillospiraceae bacterium]|nr:hypothetical protein [Oscillospiraceae bacterium]
MIKYTEFVIALCFLIVLFGCMDVNSAKPENTAGQTNTIQDNTGASLPSAETELSSEEIITSQDTVSMSIPSTDSVDESDQTNTTQSDGGLFEYDAVIGEPWYTVSSHVRERILLEQQYVCVFWKDARGYHIALTGDDRNSIRAVVIFSEDMELMEAVGIELIKPIEEAEREKWIGKKEAEFITQYGPCHYQFGSGFYIPCYVAETGTIYWLSFDETDRDVIKKIQSFSIKDLSYMYPSEFLPQVIDALQELGLPTELAPQCVPDGYTVDYLNKTLMTGRTGIYVKLKNQQGHRISVKIVKCSDSDLLLEEQREIQASTTRAFSSHGRTFYLIEKEDGWSGVWTDGSYLVSFDGFETVEDLKDTIRTIK